MQDDKKLSEERRSPKKQPLSWQDRAGFTPTEFSHLFGKQSVWGYRQIYAGRVKCIKGLGRLLIPRSELDRILNEASQFEPKQAA